MSDHEHRLADIEKRAAMWTSFEIPSRRKRENLQPGDLVKLVFKDIGERLWVEVRERLVSRENLHTRMSYIGVIDSSPLHFSVRQNDEVIFGPEHVADIQAASTRKYHLKAPLRFCQGRK
jgi:hypothetical protein